MEMAQKNFTSAEVYKVDCEVSILLPQKSNFPEGNTVKCFVCFVFRLCFSPLTRSLYYKVKN